MAAGSTSASAVNDSSIPRHYLPWPADSSTCSGPCARRTRIHPQCFDSGRCRGLTRSLRVLVSLDDANIVIGSVAQHLSLSVRFVNRQSAQMPDDNNGAYLLERQGGASL